VIGIISVRSGSKTDLKMESRVPKDENAPLVSCHDCAPLWHEPCQTFALRQHDRLSNRIRRLKNLSTEWLEMALYTLFVTINCSACKIVTVLTVKFICHYKKFEYNVIPCHSLCSTWIVGLERVS